MKHLTLLTTVRSETVSGNVNAPNQDIGQALLIFFSCFQKQYHFQKDHQKYEHQFPNIYISYCSTLTSFPKTLFYSEKGNYALAICCGQ